MTDFGQLGPFRSGDVLLEQFEITRMLGVGGHAYVYECRDQFLDELLAVKVIPNPPNRGRELLDRARAEAQLLRRLSHPNVVRMHTAAAPRDDVVCLVMEKLDGISLRHLLALLSRLSVVEALTIVRQVAVGVGAAHQLDVVHRDIKPDNVFVLPPNNHVKVLDFGIAKFLGNGLQTSNKYKFQGTPLYMSPEHLRGAGVTVRSDIYQLGIVLFELLAGINPNLIDLDNPGFEQVAMVQIARQTPSLVAYAPNVPDYVDRLIQRATAKDPEQRFGEMSEFVHAIDWTLKEYQTFDPNAVARIRYVDSNLMAAARKLGAVEAAYGTGQVPTTPPDKTERASVSGPAPDSRLQPVAPLHKDPRPQSVASYHPVPMLAEDLTPVRAPAPPKVANLSSGQPPKTLVPQTSLSAGFVLFAIAFGIFGGSAALWFVLRGSPPPINDTPATGLTAAAPMTASPSTASPSTASPSTASPSTASPSTASSTMPNAMVASPASTATSSAP